MKHRHTPAVSLATVAAISLVLSACNLTIGVATPELSGLEATVAVRVRLTSEARIPGTEVPADVRSLVTDTPAATVVPATSTATVTSTPTLTPLPSASPTITLTPLPCNRAQFVTDVTVPDGSEYTPNSHFNKIWRLRNAGTCSWDSAYTVVFDHGDRMSGPESFSLTGGVIPPGGTVDVTVALTAPGSAGEYAGYWKIRDPGGIVFGVGGSGNVPIFVDIKVLPEPSGPDFNLAFENVHNCAAGPYATFRIGNSGSVGFESIWLKIVDTDTNTPLYPGGSNNAPFLPVSNECPPKNSSMGPGSVYFIAAFIGAAPPHGHHAKLTLKMCTADNQGGTCMTKELSFVIP